MIKRALTLATLLVVQSVAGFWIFVGYRILFGTSNHIGVDVAWVRYVAVLGVVLAGALWLGLSARRFVFFAVAVCAMSLMGSYVIDRYNILVPYEVWLKRGMPERMPFP